MIGKRFRSLPFIFANDNYTLRFDINKINLAELERRTGLTRAQLRRLKKNNFQVIPHALTGRKADTTIISGYSGVIDDLLKKGVSNSEVILERIQEQVFIVK